MFEKNQIKPLDIKKEVFKNLRPQIKALLKQGLRENRWTEKFIRGINPERSTER